MRSLRVRQFPDAVLRRVSEPVTKMDRTVQSIINLLIETMRKQPGGVGIAAPQVGILKQIAIVDVSPKIKGRALLILINPIITSLEEEGVWREGCMSLPDFTANVKRADRIHVKWLDTRFQSQKITTTGLEARCIQHEVDHLNGMLFLDRVASLKSDVFRRKRYL